MFLVNISALYHLRSQWATWGRGCLPLAGVPGKGPLITCRVTCFLFWVSCAQGPLLAGAMELPPEMRILPCLCPQVTTRLLSNLPPRWKQWGWAHSTETIPTPSTSAPQSHKDQESAGVTHSRTLYSSGGIDLYTRSHGKTKKHPKPGESSSWTSTLKRGFHSCEGPQR
jgi:hypothetical protein